MTAFGRGGGAVEAVQAALPDAAVTAFGLVTQLGDVWFLVTLTTLVYWFGSRRAGAFAVGAVLGALALTVALKAAFALPRPPPALWRVPAHGYGFPSGHAIAATVGWGTLAHVLAAGPRRRRVAIATVVVGLVAVSRVVLGVHFPVDVVVGIAVGGAYLTLLVLATDGDPTRAFGLAVVVALAAVAASGVDDDAVLLLGGSVGAFAAWTRIPVAPAPWRRGDVLPAAGAAVAFGGLLYVAYRFALPVPVTAGVGLAAAGGIIAAPAVVERARARS